MRISKFHKKSILIGATLLLAQSGAALSQEAARTPNQQFTVDGPYTIQQNTSSDVAKISISRGVSYADLDLSNSADVDAFKGRVREAAWDVCKQIDSRYPASASDLNECITTAAHDALQEVRVIVASRENHSRVASLP